MEHLAMTQQLALNADTVRALVAGISEAQARWKPTPDDWSILEVINHLYDEEREDFRQRVDYVLHRPGEDPPPIDPQGWVTARSYNERDLTASVQNWLAERQHSIAWLNELADPQWEQPYHRPDVQLKAGDLFASWLAHDFLHLRQLVELHYVWAKRLGEPYDVAYAGDW